MRKEIIDQKRFNILIIKGVFSFLFFLFASPLSYAKIDVDYFTMKDSVSFNKAQLVRQADKKGQRFVVTSLIVATEANTFNDIEELESLENNAGKINSPALVYPNPFSVSKVAINGKKGGWLGYNLDGDANVQLLIYDMRGNEIVKKLYTSSQPGGLAGYNHVSLSPENLGISSLPSAPYFFLLRVNGDIQGRGKFVAMP